MPEVNGLTYLVPGPDRPERIHERDVFPQVGEKPETRGEGVGQTKQNDTEDSHSKEGSQQPQETPTEVVDSLAQKDRPQRVKDDGEDDNQRQEGVELALELTAFVQPCVVQFISSILLSLNLDSPETLGALLRRAVRMFGGALGYPEGQHRHGQQFEGVL